MSQGSQTNIPQLGGTCIKPPKKNLVNQKFGRLLVISFSHYDKKYSKYWNCKCECGNEKSIRQSSLLGKCTISCGCYFKETNRTKSIGHGLTHHPSGIYKIWTSIIQRCTNPKNPGYKYYGGRGISICDKWLNSVEVFFKDVGSRPSKNHSIDRIDPNGNYEPDNVRWATRLEQSNNMRNSIKFTVSGITGTATYWNGVTGTNRQTILTRYFRGYTDEECIYGKNPSRCN